MSKLFSSLSAFVSVLATSLIGCDGGRGAAPEMQSRLEAASAAGAKSFDFAEGADFKWDRIYIFPCYSTQASVDKSLGFAWPDFSKTTVERSDSVVLVVFVYNQSVVGWFEQPRSIDLCEIANETGYDRASASFQLDRFDGRVIAKPIAQ